MVCSMRSRSSGAGRKPLGIPGIRANREGARLEDPEQSIRPEERLRRGLPGCVRLPRKGGRHEDQRGGALGVAESDLDGPGASAPEHGGAIDAESDRYLPQYDVTETHAVVVDADTDLTWQAVRRSDLSQSAIIRVLLEMRCLPNRLQRVLKRRPSEPSRSPLTLDDMQRAGFLLLGEWPGHEIVFGTVVQPWKAVTGYDLA